MSAFSTGFSTTGKKAHGVNAPLSQLGWVCRKVGTTLGPCKAIALHRRGVCVLTTNATFHFLYSLEENSFSPPRAGSPKHMGSSSSRRTLSQLSSAHLSLLSLSLLLFCDHLRYLLLSFPGPWKQRDSLPEGWHLERLLSSLQGDAGPVHAAHTAQQPPEAAVRRRLRHRFVSIAPGPCRGGMQLVWERGAVGQETRKRMGRRGRKEGAHSP